MNIDSQKQPECMFLNLEALIQRSHAEFNFNKFTKLISSGNFTAAEQTAVIEAIDNIVFGKERDQFIQQLSAGIVVYRARIIDVQDIDSILKRQEDGLIHGYDWANSKEPPLRMGGEGRNNIPGQTYLYVAENIETACMEVKSVPSQIISVAEFKVKKDLNILDFYSNKRFDVEDSKERSLSLATLFTSIMFNFYKPVVKKEEYHATQFLSDYIRKTGIDGICYRSYYTTGKNYVIFNCCKNYIEFADSRLIINQGQVNAFIDINAKTSFHSNPLSDLSISQEIISGNYHALYNRAESKG